MRFFYALGLLLIGFCPAEAQRSAPSPAGYVDFVVSGLDAWLLTRAGTLERGNWRTGRSTPVPLPSAVFLTAIARDTANALVAADSSGRIWRFDLPTQQWSFIVNSPHKNLYGLAVDRHGQILTISRAGIWSSGTGKTYFPGDSLFLNKYITAGMRSREKPIYLLDSQDRLWLGFAYGEWGGELFVFDTDKKQFLRPQLGDFDLPMNPVVSIIEGGNNVFVTAGMAHFTTHGAIARFNDTSGTTIFKSDAYWRPVKTNGMKLEESVGGEYIGPAAFEPRSNCLYFYSQNGVFKGNVKQDLSTIGRWRRIVRPNLRWTGGQRNAIGPAMNALKMAFTSGGKLLLLTEHEGLGWFDGKTFRFIRQGE